MRAIPTPPAGSAAIKLEGNFSYDEEAEPTLKDVQLTVSQGQLIAVVGSTGSGKSSLLSATLGLMEQHSGPEVAVYGSVRHMLIICGGIASRFLTDARWGMSFVL